MIKKSNDRSIYVRTVCEKLDPCKDCIFIADLKALVLILLSKIRYTLHGKY